MTGQPDPQPLDASRASPTRPKQIGGFEIIRKIGQGGMGAVFLARQVSLERIVALKVLPPSIAQDASFIERFQREARASARLNHPNIIQGIDVGKDEATGLWYFAMEYIDGPSLLQVLKEQRVLPEERALKYVRDIAEALECAAANGIVHRDIKPDNILLNGQDEAKLADLGLAKQVSSQDPSVTQSGQSVGTPFYMPPEQARGESDQIDVRSDLYALGCTLFHLVTGQPPFTGETAASIMAKHLVEPPPKANRINPAVSEATARLVSRLMQKKKEQRFETPHEVVQQIDRILNREDTAGLARTVRRETTGPRAPIVLEKDAPQRSPALMFSIGVGGVVLLGVVGFLLFGWASSPPETVAVKPSRTGVTAPEVPPVVPGGKTDPASQFIHKPVVPPAKKTEAPVPPDEVQRPVPDVGPLDPAAAREQLARTRLGELQTDEENGRLPPLEVRLRLSQIARDFGQTQAGREAAARLALLPEPPPPPAGAPALQFSFDRATLSAGAERATVADLSGGERHGVIVHAETVPGVIGEALRFNGRSTSVVVAPPPALGPALTVSAWVRYDVAPTGGWQNVIVCQDNGKAPRVFQLSTLDGRLCWHRFGNGADIVCRERIEAKRWYHAAATFDPVRREHRLYVDGVLVGQAPGGFVPHPTERICIGCKGSDEPRMFFNGAIDELAIWSQALTEQRIRELYEEGRPGARPAPATAGLSEQEATKLAASVDKLNETVWAALGGQIVTVPADPRKECDTGLVIAAGEQYLLVPCPTDVWNSSPARWPNVNYHGHTKTGEQTPQGKPFVQLCCAFGNGPLRPVENGFLVSGVGKLRLVPSDGEGGGSPDNNTGAVRVKILKVVKGRPPGEITNVAEKPVPGPADAAGAVQQLFIGVFKDAVALLGQNRIGDAVSLLERKAADPKLADAQELLKRAKTDVEAITELRRQAVEALRAKTGQKITLKKGNGTISGKVKDDPRARGVTLDVGGPEVTLSAEQLHPQDVDAQAPRTGQPTDELRRRGMLFLAAGDLAAAKDLFGKARDAGGGDAAAPYLEYLTVLELGEVEAAARKAWTAAEALFDQKRLKEAEAAYGAFQQKYHDTRTAAQNAEALKQRLAAISKANKPEIVFIAKESMNLFPVGHRQMEFPVQGTDDPLGPFEKKPVYFNQKTGTDVVYDVRSPRPLRELRWKGAAMQKMTIEILDAKGAVVASSGPHEGGNKWAEFTLAFEPRTQFVLRFRNHISTWYFIAELELK